MLDVNSLKSIITNIVNKEVNKALKEQLPNAVKEELKNYLFDKFVENTRNNSIQSFTNEVGVLPNQKPQPPKSDKVSLRELLSDTKSTYNQEINRPQYPIPNAPRINTHNPRINNILQDMMIKGYDHVPSENSMNPIASYAMEEMGESYTNNTGLYGNISSRDMYQGSAGPGVIANPSPDEIVIK